MDFNTTDLDGLGMRRRYGGGGGGPTVLENFDTGPLTGSLAWDKTFEDGSVQTVTVTSSVLHVTQGTNSWKLTGTKTGSNFPGIETTNSLDLSAYTSISIDVYVETIGILDAVYFYFESAGGAAFFTNSNTTTGTTGAYTLTTNVSDIVTALGASTAVYVSCYTDGSGISSAVTFYMDNLRAS